VRAILDSDCGFAAIRRTLVAAGYVEQNIAGLRLPLLEGEPELARFVRGGDAIVYSFNPALRLRIVDGCLPPGLPTLPIDRIAELIASDDPETALRGAFAAAELGLGQLHAPVDALSRRLPVRLGRLAANAATRLETTTLPREPTSLRDSLRRAIAGRAPEAPALISAALGGDRETSLTAMIGAARLGLVDLADRIALLPSDRSDNTTERAFAQAIRRATLATLRGRSPGAGDTARDLLWRSLLGEVRQDNVSAAVAALIDPVPARDLNSA
jgi:hypothetical protein